MFQKFSSAPGELPDGWEHLYAWGSDTNAANGERQRYVPSKVQRVSEGIRITAADSGVDENTLRFDSGLIRYVDGLHVGEKATIRAKMPAEYPYWPAIWCITDQGWQDDRQLIREIDLIEVAQPNPSGPVKSTATTHFGYWDLNANGQKVMHDTPTSVLIPEWDPTVWHDYTVEVHKTEAVILWDGVEVLRVPGQQFSYEILINLAAHNHWMQPLDPGADYGSRVMLIDSLKIEKV